MIHHIRTAVAPEASRDPEDVEARENSRPKDLDLVGQLLAHHKLPTAEQPPDGNPDERAAVRDKLARYLLLDFPAASNSDSSPNTATKKPKFRPLGFPAMLYFLVFVPRARRSELLILIGEMYTMVAGLWTFVSYGFIMANGVSSSSTVGAAAPVGADSLALHQLVPVCAILSTACFVVATFGGLYLVFGACELDTHWKGNLLLVPAGAEDARPRPPPTCAATLPRLLTLIEMISFLWCSILLGVVSLFATIAMFSLTHLSGWWAAPAIVTIVFMWSVPDVLQRKATLGTCALSMIHHPAWWKAGASGTFGDLGRGWHCLGGRLEALARSEATRLVVQVLGDEDTDDELGDVIREILQGLTSSTVVNGGR